MVNCGVGETHVFIQPQNTPFFVERFIAAEDRHSRGAI